MACVLHASLYELCEIIQATLFDISFRDQLRSVNMWGRGDVTVRTRQLVRTGRSYLNRRLSLRRWDFLLTV